MSNDSGKSRLEIGWLATGGRNGLNADGFEKEEFRNEHGFPLSG